MLMLCVWIVVLLITGTHCEDTDYDYDVIIMGAGLAGLAAGKTLYDAGITNFVIVEAQEYIGGRVVTERVAGQWLNTGATWIHGACKNERNISKCAYNGTSATKVNPMFELAHKYDVPYVETDWYSQLILDIGGMEFDVDISLDVYSKYLTALNCIDEIISKIKKDELNDMNYFTALDFCGWKKPYSSIEKTIDWYMFAFEFAQITKLTSVGRSESTFGSQDVMVTEFSSIIRGLAAEYLNLNDIQSDEKIKLKTPITMVEYDHHGISVTTNNGEQYTAKYGIVTFPLGVLQSDIIEFKPQLPEWKRYALMKTDFVDYTLIYVKWPYNFWESQLPDITEIILLNDERFGFFTGVINLDHPKYSPGSLIWRFDLVEDIGRLVEFQNINDTIRMLIDLKLKHYFGNDMPDPVDIFVSSWTPNPYFQGAFSVRSAYVTDDTIDAMNWNLKQRLFFAGEAMVYNNPGTTDAAYLSGIDTTNEMLSCMGFDENETDGIECRKIFRPRSNNCHRRRWGNCHRGWRRNGHRGWRRNCSENEWCDKYYDSSDDEWWENSSWPGNNSWRGNSSEYEWCGKYYKCPNNADKLDENVKYQNAYSDETDDESIYENKYLWGGIAGAVIFSIVLCIIFTFCIRKWNKTYQVLPDNTVDEEIV